MNARNQFVPPLSPNFNGRRGNDPRVTSPSYEVGGKGNVSCARKRGKQERLLFILLSSCTKGLEILFCTTRVDVLDKNEGIKMGI